MKASINTVPTLMPIANSTIVKPKLGRMRRLLADTELSYIRSIAIISSRT